MLAVCGCVWTETRYVASPSMNELGDKDGGRGEREGGRGSETTALEVAKRER